MKRLTAYYGDCEEAYLSCERCGKTGIHEYWTQEDCTQTAVDRLAAIEDILGDEYDLERMRLLLENDKSCYTCKNYKGEKICGFKGLDVEINPQEGCSVRKAALRREQE